MSGNEENQINNTNKTNKTKDELLQELNAYIDLSSGRKRRSDKGKRRHVYNSPMYQSKMHIYNKVRARLANRDSQLKAENDGASTLLSVEYDENGFYLSIPETYKTISCYYKQDYHGRAIEHTTRKVRTQKGIDLERYRFEAWQQIAVEQPDKIVEPSPDIRGLLYNRYGFTGSTKEVDEAIDNRQVPWLTFFAEMYFIRIEDANKWDYETWREYYDLCPVGQLPDDFEFIYGVKPGTEYFHPEWAYIANRKAAEEERLRNEETKRKSEQFISNIRGGR